MGVESLPHCCPLTCTEAAPLESNISNDFSAHPALGRREFSLGKAFLFIQKFKILPCPRTCIFMFSGASAPKMVCANSCSSLSALVIFSPLGGDFQHVPQAE